MKKWAVLFFAGILSTSLISSATTDWPSWQNEDQQVQEILEIESMFVEGVINKAEADMLYNHFVYEKHMFGGGMFIEINGAYYGITFTKAYRCVKSVGKTLGCLVASRSVACVYSDDAKEIVKSCRLKKLN